MTRRAWTGAVAGVLGVLLLLAVAVGAYNAGTHHTVVTRAAPGGEVVRVVDGHHWGYGPRPGFFLVPLLLGILLVVLIVRSFRGGYGGWHPHQGPPPWAPTSPEEAFRDWHRRAHEETATSPGTVPPPGPPPSD